MTSAARPWIGVLRLWLAEHLPTVRMDCGGIPAGGYRNAHKCMCMFARCIPARAGRALHQEGTGWFQGVWLSRMQGFRHAPLHNGIYHGYPFLKTLVFFAALSCGATRMLPPLRSGSEQLLEPFQPHLPVYRQSSIVGKDGHKTRFCRVGQLIRRPPIKTGARIPVDRWCWDQTG